MSRLNLVEFRPKSSLANIVNLYDFLERFNRYCTQLDILTLLNKDEGCDTPIAICICTIMEQVCSLTDEIKAKYDTDILHDERVGLSIKERETLISIFNGEGVNCSRYAPRSK